MINEIDYLYKNNVISMMIIIDIEQLKLNEDDWDGNIEFILLLFHWLNDSNIISFSSFISMNEINIISSMNYIKSFIIMNTNHNSYYHRNLYNIEELFYENHLYTIIKQSIDDFLFSNLNIKSSTISI